MPSSRNPWIAMSKQGLKGMQILITLFLPPARCQSLALCSNLENQQSMNCEEVPSLNSNPWTEAELSLWFGAFWEPRDCQFECNSWLPNWWCKRRRSGGWESMPFNPYRVCYTHSWLSRFARICALNWFVVSVTERFSTHSLSHQWILP